MMRLVPVPVTLKKSGRCTARILAQSGVTPRIAANILASPLTLAPIHPVAVPRAILAFNLLKEELVMVVVLSPARF
jgi:hypothetical protein